MITNKKKEKGFALVFVIAVIAALSVMTTSMFFYYDNDLKSVSRNSVLAQVRLASETGLQEGQKWISDQLNSDTFALADIQNSSHIDAADNKCLNRHGYTDSNYDIYFAKRLSDNLGNDDPKFEGMGYEVFVQRHADYVRSIYFSGTGDRSTSLDRSAALVRNFRDFPNEVFTIEMWVKNMHADEDTYDMHAFEWGRRWDLVFKVRKNANSNNQHQFSPRLGEVVLATSGDESVGEPELEKWTHLAWVWTGGNSAGNVKIYQDGVLEGTFTADIDSRSTSGLTNPDNILPPEDYLPLAIGHGLAAFVPDNAETGDVNFQQAPWLGNIAEMRIWNIARTGTDIANNNRKRITGSEPGLVSYYKFNEGAGNIAKDFNTSREVGRRNDAMIYGIGTQGTKWETTLEIYPKEKRDNTPDNDADDTTPVVNVPPGEDVVLYRILSCGKGPQGQLLPLELIVSAPVSEGDVGDGKITLSTQDVSELSGQDGSPLSIPLSNLIGNEEVTDDIKISQSQDVNSNFYVFKRALEQCTNRLNYTNFSSTATYTEGQCVEYENKLWFAEEAVSADDFDEEQWNEVLGSGCDGIQFRLNNNTNNGHYYKYFTTRPNIGSPTSADAITWDEARRRAELSTCGGMRGYLISVDNAAENNFIRDAINNDTGITFHGNANLTRSEMYGSNFSNTLSEHYAWLGNSDWRTEGTWASESGPNKGNSAGYTNWNGTEPSDGGADPGEDYADMEINRDGRANGGWNDLRLRPNPSGALDAISGYIVEYGGWDYTNVNLDLNNDGDTTDNNEIDQTTKICYARATIRKAEYVKNEDYLFYDTTFDDASDGIVADTSTDSDSQLDEDPDTAGNQNTYPGWNHYTGVLTLIDTDLTGSSPTVPEWSGSSSYSSGDFVWYNNRVWKALVGISNSSTNIDQTPSLYNTILYDTTPAWELVDGQDAEDPCSPISDWLQAFEGIKYFNDKVSELEEGAGEIDPADGTNNFQNEVNADVIPKLGERVVTFSLGPLHIYDHTDGFQHFYEFYSFPTPAGRFEQIDRTWTHSLRYANQLRYFGKQGYMANITSLDESEVLREKVKSTGWLGGLRTGHGDTNANVETCGGFRQLSETRGRRSQVQYDRIFKNPNMQSWSALGDNVTIADEGVFFDEISNRRTIYQNLTGSSITWATKPTLSSIVNTALGTQMTKVWVDTPQGSRTTNFDSNCTLWRWVTGPESFLDNGVGLVWDKGSFSTNDWDRNGTTEGVQFGTEIVSSAPQIGEIFKDNGTPFEDWAMTHPNEPNNSGGEWLAHTVGLGNCAARDSISQQNKAACRATYELYWNDLPEKLDWDGTETFAPKGIVVEYGGLENESDPRLRFSTQRVIKLQARQLNQATITISSGAESGDTIVFGTEELSDAGVTASTSSDGFTVELNGEGSCQEYVGLLQNAFFTQNATAAGTRTIKVSLGNVTKPTSAEHYYQVVEDNLTYAQADFQASYQNLCGLQGYLAYVQTSADATAVSQLTLESGDKSWINGSDETIGGTFNENEWRYTSGPKYLESFWKVRAGTDASVTNFESANFATGQPSNGGADYFVWNNDNSNIEQDDGDSNSDITSYIIRYGGSVGDFAEADVEEDNNDIIVLLPPTSIQISFYDDGSDNSIYMVGEDTVKIDSGDLGDFTETTAFSGISTPLELSAPSNTATTVEQFKQLLSKVYYQNCSKDADCSQLPDTYTPGNRKIKITLVYASDSNLNQTIGVVKNIGSRNKVDVSSISWSNRPSSVDDD